MSDNQPSHPFNQKYFHTGTYAKVDFYKKYTQYWWSNRFYANLVRKFGPGSGRVLELGCGLGHLLAWLAPNNVEQAVNRPSPVDRLPNVGQAINRPSPVDRLPNEGQPDNAGNSTPSGYEVFGTDINEWALEQARQLVPQGQFLVRPAEDLSVFPDGHFQVVITKHVVEHLPEPELAIAEMSRVLAPGGMLLFATPNFDSPGRLWKKERWIGYQDKTHISLLRPAEWLGFLKKHGLQPRKVFSDGFWDVPYLPVVPARLQKLFFGAPGGLQAILSWSFLPLWLGESMIVIAYKKTT